MTTSNKKALVTLAIGDKYEKMFDRYCRKNWKDYCDKYSYDLVAITNALDDTDRAKDRSPAWQKLLILSQEWSSKYEQIVWVDTDIVINNKLAPNIAEIVPVDKVGAVETYSIPSKEIHGIALHRAYDNWRSAGIEYIDNITPGLYYENRGIPGGQLQEVVQTGVFVCSPKYHRDIFERIYYNYEDRRKSPEWNYEMPAMSYELIKENLVYWIPPQFNFCVNNLICAYYPFIFHPQVQQPPIERLFNKIKRKFKLTTSNANPLMGKALQNIYELGYFIHFAGCAQMMENLYDCL